MGIATPTCKCPPQILQGDRAAVRPGGGLKYFLPIRLRRTNTVRGEPVEPPAQRPSTGSGRTDDPNGYFQNSVLVASAFGRRHKASGQRGLLF